MYILQSFGLEDVVTLGVVLCFSNLCHKGGGSSGAGSRGGSNYCHPVPPWPTASLTDVTVVSQNPKDSKHKEALARFKKHLPVSFLCRFFKNMRSSYTITCI